MTGADLLRRRTAIGLSQDQIGELLNEHADQVTDWESIQGKLPGSVARQLDWLLANLERQQALKTADLPPCPEMESIFAGVSGADLKDVERRLKLSEDHEHTCPLCQGQAAFLATLPPLPPPPLSPSLRLFSAVASRVERLPPALRPAAWGALLIGALTLVRAALLLVLSPRSLSVQTGVSIVAAIGIGAYGGAVGGVAYAVVRPRVQRLGRWGDYLTGVACTYAYFVAFGLPIALLSDDPIFETLEGWGVLLVAATIVGLLVGHFWLKSDHGVSVRV